MKNKQRLSLLLAGSLAAGMLTGCSSGGTMPSGSSTGSETKTTGKTTEKTAEKTTDKTDEKTTDKTDEEATEQESFAPGKEEDPSLKVGTVKRGAEEKNCDKWLYSIRKQEEFTDSRGELYYIPVGVAGTQTGDKILQELDKAIQEWTDREPSFQGYNILKRKHEFEHESYVRFQDFNGILSVVFEKYHSYTEDGALKQFYEVDSKVYDLHTGNELELKDLFYDDTDWMKLIDSALTQYRMSEEKSGISLANPKFIIGNSGGLQFLSVDEAMITVLSSIEFAEKSAIRQFGLQEAEYANECDMYFYHDQDSYVTVETAETQNYLGIPGLAEKMEFVKTVPVPGSVMEAAKKYLAENCSVGKEKVQILHDRLAGTEHFVKMEKCSVSRMGSYYCFEPAIHCVDTGDADWDTVRETAGDLSELLNYFGEEKYYFDANGNVITYADLFEEDVDLKPILANEIYSQMKEAMEQGWSNFDMELSLETIEQSLDGADILFDMAGLRIQFPNSNDGIWNVGWAKLKQYMK